MPANRKRTQPPTPKPWQWWVEKVTMPLLVALIPAVVVLINTGVIRIPPEAMGTPTASQLPPVTGTPSPSDIPPSAEPTTPVPPSAPPLAGTWEGITTGTNNNVPISERVTTMLIPADCKTGSACGVTTYEGGCAYEMILTSVQDDVYLFEIELITGAEFCTSGNSEQYIQVTVLSEEQVEHYFHSKNNEGLIVVREGVLTRE